jgi:hypothetical protein
VSFESERERERVCTRNRGFMYMEQCKVADLVGSRILLNESRILQALSIFRAMKSRGLTDNAKSRT